MIIKNRSTPTIYGVGYLGEGNYNRKNDFKAYERWRAMFKRCYCKSDLERHTTYKGCIVCEEWHNFQNFADWFYKNYYEVENETMELDKDILHKDNKIYSPNTCCFVTHRINNLFTKRNKSRGELPIGVYKNRIKYVGMCNIYKNNKYVSISLGTYSTPEQAFNEYKKFKEDYIKQVADEYKNRIPKQLYDAMYKYEVKFTD
jgi:hypothetical protein